MCIDMNKCNICHCNLGLFSKNKRIRDGYICDDCLKRSGINKPKIEITIKDVRNALYGDLPEPQKKAVPKASSHNDKDNVIDKYFRINKAAHRFSFGSGADYKYNQLVSYELLEDDETVTTGGNGIKRAVVGGILAGTAGAIVGASTAKNSPKQLANMLKIKVVIDPDNQVRYVHFDVKGLAKDTAAYRAAYKNAQQVMAMLGEVEQYNRRQNAKPADEKAISIPEQIKEYKSLLDCGAITQEEYDIKKKELLKS